MLKIFAASVGICAACIFLIDGENFAAFNILLGAGATISAGIAVGAQFHHLTSHSIAQKFFHAFTIFAVCRTATVSAPHFYGYVSEFGDFLHLLEKIFATGQLIGRTALSVSALSANIILAVIIVVCCYLCEEEVQWPITMFILWAIMLGIAALALFVGPL